MSRSIQPNDADTELLRQAEELLALSDTQIASMSNSQVAESISAFRGIIRNVSDRLTSLGDTALTTRTIALPPPQPTAATSGSTHDVTGAQDIEDGGSDAEFALSGQPEIELIQQEEFSTVNPSEWQVPPYCVPIHANVVTFDWKRLCEAAQFDVVMMDPPWQLATANPTRGVALGYSQLCDQDIGNIPVPQLQREGGLLFVWVINAKYKWTLDQFDRWGYRLVDEIVWVKATVNRRLAKSHGYYLQHAKEVCLVARKKGGKDPLAMRKGGVGSDVIFSMRRGNSQKPTEIYDLIEELVPNGRYLEIFARKNNLRDFWVSVGNEVTGTGLPEADLAAIRGGMTLPGAVYGRSTSKR